jgi:hypothetical protein
MKKTLADKIRAYVWATPGRTATQIAKAIQERPGSVSSFLHKAWRDGTMRRRLHRGPRGGAVWS